MKIQPYSEQDLQIRKAKVESKFKEMKENFRSIRDVAEWRAISPEIDNSQLGLNVDLYV